MMTNVFSPVGIDIGNRMAESLDQLGFTFLYHGTPLCMIIRNYCIFILFFRRAQVQILCECDFFYQ
ncbi:amino acid acetyltransferase [Escherichia sp. E4385]|nr:amino acid acetyltransferase [Escherichia sp. E4385]